METPSEEMTVELELDDGSVAKCEVITVLEAAGKDYIALLPQGQDPESEDAEVWFYRLIEDENDPNAEPELEFIESDEEYDKVAEAFEEFLDELEYDELNDEE